MLQAFQEGGATMWLVLLSSLVANPFALGAAVAAFVTKKRAWQIGIGTAAIAFGLMTLTIGIAAYFYWLHEIEAIVAFADPGSQALLLERGREEAMNNVWLGVVGSVMPLLFGGLAVVRGGLNKPDAP